tara:strand:- start:438 stop:656 length:219 start_codon:yes stop_codon:yes gene_type:complete
LLKVANNIMPEYQAWIMASRFCILSTVVSEDTDGSPRGDDGRLSLMFIVAGKTNVVRVNGRPIVTAAPDYVA